MTIFVSDDINVIRRQMREMRRADGAFQRSVDACLEEQAKLQATADAEYDREWRLYRYSTRER